MTRYLKPLIILSIFFIIVGFGMMHSARGINEIISLLLIAVGSFVILMALIFSGNKK